MELQKLKRRLTWLYLQKVMKQLGGGNTRSLDREIRMCEAEIREKGGTP